MKKLIVMLFASLYISSASAAFAVEYSIDNTHSHIGFAVKHLVISNVKGKFNNVSGTFELDEKDNIKKANLEIEASSIDTDNEKRDKHLKSGDFLDAGLHPKIVFTYKRTLSKEGNSYKVVGDFTIRGTTKEIILTGELLGKVIDPWGNNRAGFTGTASFDRRDFGLVWNKVLDAGGVVVGNTINISLEFEGIQKK